MPTTVTCLWFDMQAEEAATFYTSLFKNSKILQTTHYGPAGPGPNGSVMTVRFVLDGQEFLGLNGGPVVHFNEAVSFQIYCDDQREVDRLTAALSAVPEAEQCGWVKDRFGLSWQIAPKRLLELMTDPDAAKARRVMEAMMTMKRIDIAAIERAAEGKPVS